MGLSYCKSLCSSSKKENVVDDRNGQAYNLPANPQIAVAAVEDSETWIEDEIEPTTSGIKHAQQLYNFHVDCKTDNSRLSTRL